MKNKILALLTYSFITLSLTAIMLGCLHVWSVQWEYQIIQTLAQR